MPQRLSLTTLLVDEYDTALSFLVGKLGFELRENTALTDGKQWIVVAPHGAASGLLLAWAVGDRQRRRSAIRAADECSCFSKQKTSPVTTSLTQQGIRLVEAPRHESYGIVAVFEDLYGNRWDLIDGRVIIPH